MTKHICSAAAITLAMLLTGCESSNGGSAKSGILEVQLTDAPGDFESVFVTIDRVAVHRASDMNDSNESNESNSTAGWFTVAEPRGTYDLLTLQNGETTQLGIGDLAAAKYTQMRLYLGDESNDSKLHPFANYVVVDGNASALTVPSMTIKENHNFTMDEGGVITMTVDFDAEQSIHSAGKKWILNPVLHVTTH